MHSCNVKPESQVAVMKASRTRGRIGGNWESVENGERLGLISMRE